MRTFSSADAKNHFGEMIDAARLAPVAVTKYDKPFVVVMGVEEFERLKSAKPQVAVKQGKKKAKPAAPHELAHLRHSAVRLIGRDLDAWTVST